MRLSFEVWPNNPYPEDLTVGVCQNSWGGMPIEWCVDRVAEHGYEGIDFFFDRLLELPDHEYDRLAATLGGYSRDKGLAIASIGAHNRGRPHRALALAPPLAEASDVTPVSPRDVRRRDLLGGLIHEYHGVAA